MNLKLQNLFRYNRRKLSSPPFILILSFRNETKSFQIMDSQMPISRIMEKVIESNVFNMPRYDGDENYVSYFFYRYDEIGYPKILAISEEPQRKTLDYYKVKSGDGLWIGSINLPVRTADKGHSTKALEVGSPTDGFDDFIISLTYKQETIKVRISNPFEPIKQLMDNVIHLGVFDMPLVNTLGDNIEYAFAKRNEDGRLLILSPYMGNVTMYLQDYKVQSGDELLVILANERTPFPIY